MRENSTVTVEDAVLDDPFGSALRGRHQQFARAHGTAIAYQSDVSVFYAHPADPSASDFADLAALAGPGGTVGLRGVRAPLPAGWEPVERFDLVVYTGAAVVPHRDEAFTLLGADDVSEMTALVELTKPGPFLPRTIELGDYYGYRDRASGRLLAMAGERSKPDGWTEISAVCTHPDARGQGLARRLIGTVAAGIVDRGDVPFLHTTEDNPARGLYEAMGFVLRNSVPLQIVHLPR